MVRTEAPILAKIVDRKREEDQYKQGVELTIVYNFGNQKVKKVRDIDSADKDIKNRTR